VLVHVAVRPRAHDTRVGGVTEDDRLRVAVRAAPVGGEANDAVIAALAEAFGVPRSAVRVVRGASARRKTIDVAGGDAARLEALKKRMTDE
jgi:hypothetical protein